MILHNSWLSHLRDINAADQANRNFSAFINATDVDKQKNDKINAITEDPDSIVLIADNHRRIKFVHSCKKFGGTRINPVVTVGGLVGQGARAFPIAVDLETATSSKNVIIPSLDKIMHCKNIDELELLTIDGKENETEEETTEEVYNPKQAYFYPHSRKARRNCRGGGIGQQYSNRRRRGYYRRKEHRIQ